jgi:hypothetical protein
LAIERFSRGRWSSVMSIAATRPIRRCLASAKSTKKPPMPAKYGKLPAAEIDALVAYMQSLK